MRELKFRSYIKCTNGMSYNFNTLSNGRNSENDMSIVMQCTGLKDDTGKEVYEGDIVKVGDSICKVVFENYSFYFEGICKNFNGEKALLFEIDEDDYLIKVIGNIYQNEDLLEVK